MPVFQDDFTSIALGQTVFLEAFVLRREGRDGRTVVRQPGRGSNLLSRRYNRRSLDIGRHNTGSATPHAMAGVYA